MEPVRVYASEDEKTFCPLVDVVLLCLNNKLLKSGQEQVSSSCREVGFVCVGYNRLLFTD